MKIEKLQFSEEDNDLNFISWRLDRHGYARTNIYLGSRKYKTVFAHHMVCERNFGKRPDWEKREVCDHINGSRLDNRRINLRITSIAKNSRNKGDSTQKGVTLHKSGKWQAQVGYYGKTIYCGLHKSREEACIAAQKKREQLHSMEEVAA